MRRELERLRFFLERVAQGGVYHKLYGADGLQRHVDTHLQRLYELLIKPLGLEAEERLTIIPYGPLHDVPFAALYDGEHYLLDKIQVSLAPSAAVYLHCKRKEARFDGPLLTFGVPVEDIPAVKDEIAAVAALFEGSRTFLGDEASLAAFFEHAPEANLLHLATHGVHRPDNPTFSGLRMGDGWLAGRDLYGSRLRASLVVLSACDTGRAEGSGGDEQFGLARAFLFAGAPSLVASL